MNMGLALVAHCVLQRAIAVGNDSDAALAVVLLERLDLQGGGGDPAELFEELSELDQPSLNALQILAVPLHNALETLSRTLRYVQTHNHHRWLQRWGKKTTSRSALSTSPLSLC